MTYSYGNYHLSVYMLSRGIFFPRTYHTGFLWYRDSLIAERNNFYSQSSVLLWGKEQIKIHKMSLRELQKAAVS